MKIICSWCGKQVGEKEPYKTKKVTHTICKECEEKENLSIEETDGNFKNEVWE